jgi:lysophospholipase L1-like esterase
MNSTQDKQQSARALVDPRDRILELLSDNVPRKKYFLCDLDDHPNPAGYSEIATLVADAFEPQ